MQILVNFMFLPVTNLFFQLFGNLEMLILLSHSVVTQDRIWLPLSGNSELSPRDECTLENRKLLSVNVHVLRFGNKKHLLFKHLLKIQRQPN